MLTLEQVHEIYGNEIVTERDISIDHFVPWSYVAHDEFWNLHPTTKSINSSKSNYLPDWNRYFSKLCRLEYFSYMMMNRYGRVKDAFELCSRCTSRRKHAGSGAGYMREKMKVRGW